jgi:hypothetical protein
MHFGNLLVRDRQGSMDAIADVLDEKKKAASVLCEKARVINDEFQFIFASARLDITLRFKDILEEILSAINSISADREPWRLANHVGIIDDGLVSLGKIASEFDSDNVKTSASYTFILTTKSDIDSFLQYHQIYSATDINERIYSALSRDIASQSAEVAESNHKKYPHSSNLYARFLRDRLNTLPEIDRLPYILALERAKTRALIGEQDEKKMRKHSIPWPLQRFGLIPARQHMKLEDLATFYWSVDGGVGRAKTVKTAGKPKSNSLAAFISLAGMKKINVLAISLITSSPIEYNVSSLMEPARDANPTAGVSMAILKRFNTIHKHIEYDNDGKEIPPSRLGFSITEHKSAHMSRQYAVVRTIDGDHWDAMIDARASGKFVDVFLVEKMLRGPSTRVEAYNAIKSAEFAKFVMPAPDMGEMVKKANKGLIQDLVNRITGRIIQYVDTSLVPLPTNPKDLEKAISDPRFVEIMTEEFLKSYSECGIDASRPADELLGTFVADLETSIVIQFARNIKLNMIELGPSATVFRDYHGETLRTRLYNLFVDIIKRSVSSSIMTKENIYEKVLIKDHLLAVLARQLSKAE